MRIGFQLEYLDPARGGAETYVYRFTEELLANGHEVHLFAGGFGKSPEGAYTHRIMHRGMTRWQRDRRFALAARKAARKARLDATVAVGRTYGADVLQPHGGTLPGTRRQNLLLLRSRLARGLKAAFDAANPRIRTHLAIEAHQYNAHPPPEVVAISEMVRRDMRTFYNVPDDRLHLVYNGVDTERFSPEARAAKRDALRSKLGLKPEEAIFLLVAHNFRLKGLRELVEAAADLAGARGGAWRIVVVGRGKPAPYQRLARRLGCAGRLVFPGAKADVVPYYGAADIYVHPTWYDPCSLVVLEALACGLPVITTRFNGAAELMEDGAEGLIVHRPDHRAALARAMERLLDPGERERMGAAARRTAEQYPLQRNFREMMAVIERAAARKEEQA